MLATERAARLLARLAALDQAAADALAEVDALDHAAADALPTVGSPDGAGGVLPKGGALGTAAPAHFAPPAAGAAAEAARWLPGIRAALERIRLECAELRFSARALREVVPPPEGLQPRLL